MATIEERVSRVEGGYEHVATKADLKDLEIRLTRQMGEMKADLIKWVVGMVLGGMVAAAAIATAVARFLG